MRVLVVVLVLGTCTPHAAHSRRLMLATLLINIDVPELERGIAFYTAAFDRRLARRLGPGFAELLGDAIATP